MSFFLRRVLGQLQPKQALWRELYGLCLLHLVVSLVFAVTFHYVEGQSWLDSIYIVWQTATTVGYGVHTPDTALGKICTMVLGTLAIMLLAGLMGYATSAFVRQYGLRRMGMAKNRMKDFYLIVNFQDASKLLLQITQMRLRDPDVGFCIIDPDLAELPRSLSELPNVLFIKGDLNLEETYERANISQAKQIFIFPSDPRRSECDFISRGIAGIVRQRWGDDTKIILELVDHRNKGWFLHKNLRLIHTYIETLIMVQESQDAGAGLYIEDLVTNDIKESTRSFEPDRLVGVTWDQFVEGVRLLRKKTSIRVSPLALVTDRRPDACPDPDHVIRSDDGILLAAGLEFDWRGFERDLMASLQS